MLNYTIVNIENIKIDSKKYVTVYTVSNDKFESHRFAANYLKNYEIIIQEEE